MQSTHTVRIPFLADNPCEWLNVIEAFAHLLVPYLAMTATEQNLLA